MKRKPTLAAGATIQRSLVRRHLRRILQVFGTNPTKPYDRGWSDCCKSLDAWLYAESARAKKPGGIGR